VCSNEHRAAGAGGTVTGQAGRRKEAAIVPSIFDESVWGSSRRAKRAPKEKRSSETWGIITLMTSPNCRKQ
jgi:hypothetical protein